MTASRDGTARVWNFHVGQWYTQIEYLLEAACERAPRNMTQEEWQQFMGDDEYRPTCPELLEE